MKILNFGSLNIDFFYKMQHIVLPGETLKSESLNVQCGGKGLNQSIALSRAGAVVYHAGKIGADGDILIDELIKSKVNVDFVKRDNAAKSGQAIIQIDLEGQNSIILYGGTNQAITEDETDSVLSNFEAGDILVLQNEISNMAYLITAAKKRNMKIYLNLAPVTDDAASYPINLVDCLMVNETEAFALCGETDPKKILSKLKSMYPQTAILLTLGADGAWYLDTETELFQPIYPVPVVNTTGAGDTFIGYFVASVSQGKNIEYALNIAAKASSVSVSREGSSASIPYIEELK